MNASPDTRGGGSRLTDRVILALLLAFPSTGFVQKYAGLAGVAGYVAAVVAAVLLAGRFAPRFAPWLRRSFRLLAGVSVGGLLAGYLLLHPIEDGKGPGKSSDRDEGLELAVTRMAAGETPYYPPNNPVAGPLSVLPGSIFLAAPFVALGSVGCQNVFWLAVLLFVAARWFGDKALALCLLAVPLALSPAAQYEFVSGGDLIANGVFVAVFFLFALVAWRKPDAPAWWRWAGAVLLGIGLASRPNFLLLAPLFSALVWRDAGFRRALQASAVVGLVALAAIVPFYLRDPAGFTPLMARQKLAVVDQALPWASRAMIAATLMVALVAAWRLWRGPAADPVGAFFRWCAIVTLTPMIAAVACASVWQGALDFSFNRDRFGLMYVGFALLGWGGRWFRGGANGQAPVVEA